MAVATKLAHGKLLFDFAKAACVDGWTAIDDRVMGGVSRSRLRHDSDGLFAVFEGNVSLERNGVSACPHGDTTRPCRRKALAHDMHHIWPARGQFGWPT
jgi:hypothetical protein